MHNKLKSASRQKDLETKHTRKKLVVSEGISTNSQKVVFSFENFGEKSHGLDCDSEEFKNLIRHLKTLSKMSWQQVQESDRHKLGSEEINVSEIRENVPTSKDKVLSFRYFGMKPFIGERKNQVLDIYYIDPAFDLYDHD